MMKPKKYICYDGKFGGFSVVVSYIRPQIDVTCRYVMQMVLNIYCYDLSGSCFGLGFRFVSYVYFLYIIYTKNTQK